MLNSIGFHISQMDPNVKAPQSYPHLCSGKILTMSFVDGENCSSAFSNISEVNTIEQRRVFELFCRNLLFSYGYQLFGIGAFHSDPHPGNVFFAQNGRCALLDFGQMKVLRDETQLLFARFIVALHENSNECVKIMRQLGLKLDRTTEEVEMLLAYLLFDTRMDIKEATISPLDLDLPPELRVISLSEIDSDIFMIIRIISMLRGIFSSYGVDVHARLIWYPFAISVLYRNGEKMNFFKSKHNKQDPPQTSKGIRKQMEELSSWMLTHNLPNDRKAMLSFAMAGVLNLSDLYTAIHSRSEEILNLALRNFSDYEREKCINLVRLQFEVPS